MSERDDLMLRTRAARFYCNNQTNERTAEQLEMAAFLDIFHPELSADQKHKMVMVVRNGERR